MPRYKVIIIIIIIIIFFFIMYVWWYSHIRADLHEPIPGSKSSTTSHEDRIE